MSIEIFVDVTNPGHYFAACGLFELTSRLDRSAEARFSDRSFEIATAATLSEVVAKFVSAGFAVAEEEAGPDDDAEEDDGGSDSAAPLEVAAPFSLVLDWWKTDQGKDLKLWAGTMNGPRIAQAMLAALSNPALVGAGLLDYAAVVFDPSNPSKKVEPFYFDARRAGNASSRDVGFAPNDLMFETLAFPAVEALCIVGLQRFRPVRVERRVFDYSVWTEPAPLVAAAALCAGHGTSSTAKTYRFESWFRTSQRKHKAFKPAILRPEGESR
jgi:CRISPR-associated endonuclease/helicase Cas3